ncbi:sugar ABC transporter ATP-binding protein [Azospirillum picis]|uniref:Ribose transport system ATP-binding protein n=1 Tax=Azospirillum picis TaxID=488438 RepID=A0ABU0MMX9_9PROT|nr:sugar ABC transporter ATP-binding protein [Azospirillum picis]MBP2300787.1 ribose transport system ATP-binding protein [Azospirillum picis]MDQ0534756.1 ribose transport system ATP-binding protein [Azospirillum picis]
MSLHIAFDGIVKEFGAVRVLHGVGFDLHPGRVYGLLGENGAGKSTLMKILAGYHAPTAGTLLIDGQPARFRNSRDAETRGIVLIHQELNLADDLTVTQNMFLGHELRRGWLLDERRMRERAAEALRQVGFEGDPDTKVRDLIVAEKQLVEIAKAQLRNARLLIMDEPTASLTPSECERLFGLIGRLRRDGVTIVYISHKLDEVERITDEVIVMRDGRFITRAPTAGTPRARMATLMVGRDLTDMFPEKRDPPPAGRPLLAVRGVTVPGWAEDVGFDLRPGEILGFAGLVGAGRTELFEGILGLRPRSAGTIEIDGRPVRLRSPREAMRNGLTYLSEDRKGKGLHVRMGLRDNLTLMTLRHHAQPLLSPASEEKALEHAVAAFGIRGDPRGVAASLSGGNQQKLAIAKFLEPDPRVFVLDEPTRGVDVGAKRDIYFLIARLAAEGRGVVVISSELIELIGLCHRVIVMRGRRVTATVPAERLSEEELIAHAIGTHTRP